MEDDDFCEHMTRRHRGSLGGLSHLWVIDPDGMAAWRAFHRRLHNLLIDLKHEHEEGW